MFHGLTDWNRNLISWYSRIFMHAILSFNLPICRYIRNWLIFNHVWKAVESGKRFNLSQCMIYLKNISIMGSYMSNRDVTWFKYLNHWILFVKQACKMIQTCYFGHGKYGTYFPLMNKYLQSCITKFVSSKFVVGMKRYRQLNRYCPWLDV
jgi:hypothetical protein